MYRGVRIFPRTTVRYRVAYARCPRQRKQSAGLFSFACAPALFESLTKYKKIKKGTNPYGRIPFFNWLGNRDFSAHYRSLSPRIRSLPTAAKTVHRTVFFRYAPALFESLIISNENKSTDHKGQCFYFGWGIGIRTPTNRVRVCRATVTQFPNIRLSNTYYIAIFG